MAAKPHLKNKTNTGQRAEGTGLYDYGAGFYDPLLGRFIQPDTVVPEPGNPLAWDKYAYAGNNPIRYNDPTGHWLDTVFDIISIAADVVDIAQNGLNWGNGLALAADVVGAVLPGITGAGALVKVVMHTDDAIDAVKAVKTAETIVDTVKAAETAEDMVQTANKTDNLVDAAKCAINSFSGDTVVATQDGEEAISELAEGELVLAYDPVLGVTAYYTVTATISHFDLLIVDLTIDGEKLQTTAEHPFYVEGYGWVLAQDLWVGAEISQAHAGSGTVTSISFALRPQRMYNLTVAQAHTFFVGQGQWLVHNACNPGLREAMGLTDPNMDAHHLIPQSFSNHPTITMASEAGWNMDHAYNGIGLPKTTHAEVPGHPGYNAFVGKRLDDIYDSAVKNAWSVEDVYDDVLSLADQLRARLTQAR